ncbi:MAG: D-alanine--D-alanine ligase [candidate division Zixibacteria bacterium]|nr:D-alanine--D-alanine ligase [candidate division Zixibacteria bacterium]
MKVLVLAGGNSSERAVSLNTGAAIGAGLNRLGHEVLAIDPATGRTLLDSSGTFLTADSAGNSNLPVAPVSTEVAVALNTGGLKEVDIVFIALHGGAGENGTLQNLLELCGKKYTGSNMRASAVAMDKALTKRLMATANIRTPDWLLFHLDDAGATPEMVDEITARFTCPFIVKPNESGSTVGLTKVERYGQIPAAFVEAAKESRHVLVEEYIHGRELTVAVLDGEPLPVVEIRPKSGLYDYEAKYTKGKSEYIVPAPVSDSVVVEIQEAARKLYEVIGAAGLARVDFLMDDSGLTYCLELNSLPGMTNLSLAPMAAKAAGIDFDQLLERIIQSGLRRRD